jgi:hypothetical protein
MWQQVVQLTKILLDNAANISMIHPTLLQNIRTASKKIQIKGVSGVQIVMDEVSTLEGFLEVYASESTKANVLSFAAVICMKSVIYSLRHS